MVKQGGIRTALMLVALAAVLALMWAQTFAVTGVDARAATPGAQRPSAPAPAALTELPEEKPDLALFAEKTPIWSPLPF